MHQRHLLLICVDSFLRWRVTHDCARARHSALRAQERRRPAMPRHHWLRPTVALDALRVSSSSVLNLPAALGTDVTIVVPYLSPSGGITSHYVHRHARRALRAPTLRTG